MNITDKPKWFDDRVFVTTQCGAHFEFSVPGFDNGKIIVIMGQRFRHKDLKELSINLMHLALYMESLDGDK